MRAYFDHCRSTYVDKGVIDEMMPWWTEKYWAPSSFTYTGTTAAEAIENSQMAYAKFFGGKPEEVHFAPSHAVANNIAIQGVLGSAQEGTVPHVITTSIEHGTTMDLVKQLEKLGRMRVTYLPVDENGLVDLDALQKSIGKDTVLVSLAAVNYMVGTIQPVKEISKIIREKNSEVLIHYDLTWALGRLPDLALAPYADIITASIERIHGPKGVTALWMKKGVGVKGPIYGSQAYSRIVPGTPDVPSIVGAGKALQLMQEGLEEKIEHMKQVRDRLIRETMALVPETLLNGPEGDLRSPSNVCLTFRYVEGESVEMYLDMEDITVDTGSACANPFLEANHVILAMYGDYERAHGAIRMTFTWTTTDEEVDKFLEVIPGIVAKLRKISPLAPKVYKE